MAGLFDALDDAHVLLTGATGFVGQAVLEKLLSSEAEVRITLLVRPRGSTKAHERVRLLLDKPVFRTWRERVGDDKAEAIASERITVLAGDLGDLPPLPSGLDVVIHAASSVVFDLPVDEAFAANVAGPMALYQALHATGANPQVVHISTCYVAGLRKGLVQERSLDHAVDPDAELAQVMAARQEAEAASRRPHVLGPLLAQARSEHRRAGARAVAQATEQARRGWVHEQLVRYGRVRANALGWPDVYTFTKALGERVVEQAWGDRQLSIVRPSIVESSLTHPYPGWIDGFKVADPLIVAYGRGKLPEFPALADAILDVIPVDYVVNATVATAAQPPKDAEPRYLHVASGRRNPLRFGRLLRLVQGYFRAHPLRDDAGAHVQVPNWSFPNGPTVERGLALREHAVQAADRAIGRLPATDRSRRWLSSLTKMKRDLDVLRRYTDLYRPYTRTEVVFDDRNARALHTSIPPQQREQLDFDVTTVDWQHYLQQVHIPSLPGLARGARRSSARSRTRELPRRTDVLAVFDLHGTVAAANLIEYELLVELAASRAWRWPAHFADLAAHAPGYLQAERRDRGDFVRAFMRRCEGMDQAQVRDLIATRVGPILRSRLHREATDQIAAHRAAGHRTVLITGQIDVFVEPLQDLFDVIVAGRMECDERGRWTGHLATSPLVDEARAAWLERYAADVGGDLSASYAYGDTYADRPWLELVGHPRVVNPDHAMYRHAQRLRWPVLRWNTTQRGRVASLARSLKGGA